MISSAVGSALALVSVESVSPDPLRLLGPGGDLGCLDRVRVVSVVISTLGHLVRAGALAINTRPGAWNMSHYYQWSVVSLVNKTGSCHQPGKCGNTGASTSS